MLAGNAYYMHNMTRSVNILAESKRSNNASGKCQQCQDLSLLGALLKTESLPASSYTPGRKLDFEPPGSTRIPYKLAFPSSSFRGVSTRVPSQIVKLNTTE